MDSFQLTPRQLLLVLFTACYDAGYDVFTRRRLIDALYEVRSFDCPLVPKLAYGLSGMKRFVRDIDVALTDVRVDGRMITFDPTSDEITILPVLSDAPVYKTIAHEDRRQVLREALIPYIDAFMREFSRKAAEPKTRPDPKKY
jgi:hypothetical protein